MEKIFGNFNAKLIVMLSSSGSEVYAIYAVRLNESMANSNKKTQVWRPGAVGLKLAQPNLAALLKFL